MIIAGVPPISGLGLAELGWAGLGWAAQYGNMQCLLHRSFGAQHRAAAAIVFLGVGKGSG